MMSISCLTISFSFALQWINLAAQFLLVALSMALWTTPNAPRPSSSQIMYLPSTSPRILSTLTSLPRKVESSVERKQRVNIKDNRTKNVVVFIQPNSFPKKPLASFQDKPSTYFHFMYVLHFKFLKPFPHLFSMPTLFNLNNPDRLT